MKKTLIVMLLGLGFIGTQLHAEIISFNNLSANSLRRVLSTTYGTTIAKDGDLKVSTGDGGCIWIRFITVGKKKILRVYSRYSRYEKRTTSEMILLANQWNDQKRLLRVAIDPKDGSMTCDYYMICVKGLDSDNLSETVKWFFSLKEDWNNFAINGGDE